MLNKANVRGCGNPSSPANLIWIIEALCVMMQELGPDHQKFTTGALTGYSGQRKGPGQRGLLHVLLFKKTMCHELVTKFAGHLLSKEKEAVTAALFDHAAFQAASNADIVSKLSGAAKLFFEFGHKAVFSSNVEFEASQAYALKSGESAEAWITRHKHHFAPDASVATLRQLGEAEADTDLGPLTLLALPWLEGDVRSSLTADHEAVIRSHVRKAEQKSSETVKVLNGTDGESLPGTQFPLGPSFTEQLPPGSSRRSLPRQPGFFEASLLTVSISSSMTSSRPQSCLPTPT